MKVIWSPTALQRAADISDYIATDSVDEAKKWLKKVFGTVKRLERFPRSGRITPEINNEHIREIFLGRYRIIYEVKTSFIDILTIRNTRQQIEFNVDCF